MSYDNAISTSIPWMCRLKYITRESVILKWLHDGYKKVFWKILGTWVPRERVREISAFLYNSLLQSIKLVSPNLFILM